MQKPTPVNEEFPFEEGLILTSTDLKGIITYANRKFAQISGYSRDELKGKSHNIVRHPDMPKAVFKELWDTIKAGKEWTGVIKNLRKDGKYYWVYAHISPVTEEGRIIGYSAIRRPASQIEREESLELYQRMLKEERDD